MDTVTKDDSEVLSGVRVFGAKNTVEDWKNRGEYYLQNAEGQRQKGCLRLAAKCFDKAGEIKRREYALAFLSFTEMEEQESTKKRGKHNAVMKEKLYSISEQLLEARDVGFLHKASFSMYYFPSSISFSFLLHFSAQLPSHINVNNFNLSLYYFSGCIMFVANWSTQ